MNRPISEDDEEQSAKSTGYQQEYPRDQNASTLKQDAEAAISERVASTDSQRWYLTKGNSTIGPLSTTEAAATVASGKFSQHDFAWCRGMSEWVKIEHVRDLHREKMQIAAADPDNGRNGAENPALDRNHLLPQHIRDLRSEVFEPCDNLQKLRASKATAVLDTIQAAAPRKSFVALQRTAYIVSILGCFLPWLDLPIFSGQAIGILTDYGLGVVGAAFFCLCLSWFNLSLVVGKASAVVAALPGVLISSLVLLAIKDVHTVGELMDLEHRALNLLGYGIYITGISGIAAAAFGFTAYAGTKLSVVPRPKPTEPVKFSIGLFLVSVIFVIASFNTTWTLSASCAIILSLLASSYTICRKSPDLRSWFPFPLKAAHKVAICAWTFVFIIIVFPFGEFGGFSAGVPGPNILYFPLFVWLVLHAMIHLSEGS